MSELVSTEEAKASTYSRTNIDYLSKENSRLVVTDKFFSMLSSISTVPTFSVKNFASWKDSIRSFLRTSFGLESLISEFQELEPIQLDSESEVDYQERVQIFKRRDLALYLILDKSINSSKELDPKFSALSTRIYDQSLIDQSYPGILLYNGFESTIKGSHLHTRINLTHDLVHLRLESLGKEQNYFNEYKRLKDSMKSLFMDLDIITKSCLIKGLGSLKEHSTVMVSLASLNPTELAALTDEMILARFIASAEQNRGLKGSNANLALYAGSSDPTSGNPKMSNMKCYNCNKYGHVSRDCPDPPKDNTRGRPVKFNGGQPPPKKQKKM
jgi:hypothetical protein